MVPGISSTARAEFRNMELGAVGRARVASVKSVSNSSEAEFSKSSVKE